MSAFLENLYVVTMVLILLGMCIFAHEFGHFLIARWCGMVVDVFSIGLGPALWKKKYKGIVYKIGWIPFGGYVALPQIDPTGMARIQGKAEEKSKVRGQRSEIRGQESEDNEARQLPAASPWKKIIVSISGGVGNIILAVLVAWIVYWIGMPATPAQQSTVVGFVAEESKAYEAGLRTGDKVVSVNGKRVQNWDQVLQLCMLHNEVTLVADYSDGRKTVTILTDEGILQEQTLNGVAGPGLCLVAGVMPGMSAAEAGIRCGDMIVKFDGIDILSPPHLVGLVTEKKDETATIVVIRDEGLVEMLVTPKYNEKQDKVLIGVEFSKLAFEYGTVVYPLPSEQLRDHSTLMFRVLKGLLTPKRAKVVAKQIGGPGAIIVTYWYIIKSSLMVAIWFTGLLNVNLAIINLLPIPVLDGGHIMFSLWEGIVGKPVSPRIVNALVNTFAVLLIGLFLLLSYRDIMRFTPAGRYVECLFRSKPDETNSTPAAFEWAIQSEINSQNQRKKTNPEP